MKREDVAADVAAPIEIDITGPLADEGAVRRFLQSTDFALVLARVTGAARLDERAAVRKLCLDLGSQAAGKAKGEPRTVEKQARAKAFRDLADLLTPKKPKAKKARKVTK